MTGFMGDAFPSVHDPGAAEGPAASVLTLRLRTWGGHQ